MSSLQIVLIQVWNRREAAEDSRYEKEINEDFSERKETPATLISRENKFKLHSAPRRRKGE